MHAYPSETKIWKYFSIGCAIGGALAGLLGFCGWLFHNDFLKTFLSDGVSMKVNTALLLMASGVGLWLLNKEHVATARLLFIFIIVLSIATIGEHLFKINLRIDEALFKDNFTDAAIEEPGRTSLLTAFNTLLVGFALLLLSFKRYNSAELLACYVFLIAYIFLLGHLFHIRGFYQLESYSGVAFHTALGLVLLAIGVLLYDVQRGWIALLYPRLIKKRASLYFSGYFFVASNLFVAIYLFIIHNVVLAQGSAAIILLCLTAIISLPVAYLILAKVNNMKADIVKGEEKIEIALDAGNLGSYDIDLATDEMVCSVQCKKNFGLKESDTFNFPDLLRAILPEYRQMVQERINYAIDNKSIYNAEYQIKWPDGSIHWISASGKPQYDADDKAISIVGVTYDITERYSERRDMERAFEQVRLSKEAAELGTFDMDLVKGTMEWDDRCRTLFGIAHLETVTYEKDFVKGLHPDDRQRVIDIIDGLFEGKNNGDYDVEYRTVGAEDKKLRWVRAKGKVFFNEKNIPVRFIGSVFDITENKEDEQRKNDFIGMVSHELKTPLTSLLAYTDILLMKADRQTDEFTYDALTNAKRQVKKMTVLINGFLNISRLESGKISIIKNDFSINELIGEVIKEAELTTTRGNLIQFEPCRDITVNADHDKIGSVLSNLLSNAIKFSPDETAITFKCEVINNMLQVSVEDKGIGIKKQDQEKLFERYYRIENEGSKTIAGFGIGLYLSDEIIKRHHGRMWVESEIGKGSTFYFTLPLEPSLISP